MVGSPPENCTDIWRRGLIFSGVVEDFLNFFPAQLVDVADLVGVHEAGIAHHVAAVGQVDGEHRAAAVAHRARAVAVQIFVVVRGNVAAGEVLLDPLEEFCVDGHQVFVLAVDGAFFHHPDLAVALDNLRLDLADFLVDEVGPILLAVHDGVARFFHAIGAERIRGARPAERGLGLLPGLQQRLIGPFRRERRIRIVLVEKLNRVEGHTAPFCTAPSQKFSKACVNCVRHNSSTFP